MDSDILDLEKRTLTFTYSWISNHKYNIADATALMNYRKIHDLLKFGSITVENHLKKNLNCKVKDSMYEDFTKIIFESEEQLTEFLLKYG